MAIIKNILFDLGGVLLDIDYVKTKTAFENLGFNHFEKMYSQYAADELFEKLETGHITEDDFYGHLLKGKTHLQKENITQAWNAMLLNFRVESLQFLTGLKNKYQLLLLSNTNIIHITAFRRLLTQQTGINSLDTFFEKVYYSNFVGLRKPGKEIFNFVLQDAAIKASETLFIDDSYNNIETADSMGFQTHLLLKEEKIEDLNYG